MNLNLTRKWRSKNFDQIVGQELSVRMLKNSLYLNQFFPVYLFSGQRGCGKTSTARVFASAINCEKLPDFQKNPKSCMLPCLACESCKSMMSGNHPDFIEIDAASHTGVDNVRQIIESSSFMPLMGSKKIYLIDEAHMLSKAAFNAFLKILEEPPASVLFILATTNPQKIIETVRSRCFQLFFKSVGHEALLSHLQHICKKEDISYDDHGLGVIVAESQGSVRDSLNILEQVRFSSGVVTQNAVQNVLGHIDDKSLLQLFESMLLFGSKELLLFIKNLKYELFSPQYLWKKIIEITRVAIWIKHGVQPETCSNSVESLTTLVTKVSLEQLHYVMQLLYEYEAVFLKTTEKHALLEMILLQIAKKNNVYDKSGASSAPQKLVSSQEEEEVEYVTIVEEEEEEEEEEEDACPAEPHITVTKNLGAKKITRASEDAAGPIHKNQSEARKNNSWEQFVASLDKLDDPLLTSIFKSGEYTSFDDASGELEVTFLKQFSFYKDLLKETEKLWLPLLQAVYSNRVELKAIFEGVAPVKQKARRTLVHPTAGVGNQDAHGGKKGAPESYPQNYADFKKNNKVGYRPAQGKMGRTGMGARNTGGYNDDVGKLVDVSDVAAWKKANMLLKYFAGSVREIKENVLEN